ncbi:hypothetical protein HYH03_000962 [Edaphochlamys debaryana]|uniref:Uncharacterized protein n=1 Tax=Edaphochlamys debaryana TaxID=47281 RepID=A0A836C5E4_9CHLO|nr:hypothetical protein HYH03_000962 [Edaphochlamys debaryana]|eukprot:KAG2501146.1 hypothetical protein HYH03_000962 [Edaphochlamys debaryana]
MFAPANELAGLSPEEAALISDVLTRLSIGNAASGAGLQAAAPITGSIRDPELEELEKAEQAIEQELRGIPGRPSGGGAGAADRYSALRASAAYLAEPGGPTAPAAAVYGQAGMPPTPAYPGLPPGVGHMQPPPPGVYAAAPYAATGPGGFLPPPSSVTGSYGGAHPAYNAPSPPAPGAMAPPAPPPVAFSATFSREGVSMRETQPQGPAQVLAAPQPGPASVGVEGSTPMPSQTMSLLQEMREKLKRQQAEAAAAAAAAAAAEPVDFAAAEAAAAGAAAAAAAATGEGAGVVGDMLSPSGSPRPAGGNGHTAESWEPSSVAATPAAVRPSDSGKTPSSQRRRSPGVPLPPPNVAAKAFTMLNARTNPDRYGPLDPAKLEPPPAKAPVKLPDQERVVRLQQLYERTSQWRKRCEERHAKARHDREAASLEGCTFSPQISTGSQLMMQGHPTSEVYQTLSKWATPTKHDGGGSDRAGNASPPRGAPSSAARSTGRPVPVGRGSGGGAASTATTTPAGKGPRPDVTSADGSSASPTPSKPLVNGVVVGSRLYNKAMEMRLRQEERVLRTLIEEEHQRRFTALVQDVTPRLYDPPEPSSRHLPSGMEECTFRPRTRYWAKSARSRDDGDAALSQRFDDDASASVASVPSRRTPGRAGRTPGRSAAAGSAAGRTPGHRDCTQGPRHGADSSVSASVRSSFAGFASSSGRPKSAPHMRPGDHHHHHPGQGHGRSGGHSSSSPPRDRDARSAADEGSSRRAGARTPTHSAHATISIAPDLDWNEFLARQGRFLADRAHKIAQMEQAEPLMPHISPGTKRLLREKELRQSLAREAVAAGEEGGQGLQAEPSGRTGASSPGRSALDRRARTVMEMYRECTFQPQITRKAAAMPSRSVEELADGGRSRREEWAEQQRTLKQEREVAEATFKPQVSQNSSYAHVRPRISIRQPDAYLAHVAQKRQQRELLRAELEAEREAMEMQQCTFRPQTTPLPAYLIRRLQEQHLQDLQAQEYAWQEANASGDGTAHYGSGSYGNPSDSGGGQQQYGYGSQEYLSGEQYGAYYTSGAVNSSQGLPPQQAPTSQGQYEADLPAATYEAIEDEPADLEAYRAAYQRALAYATAQPKDA